MMIVMCEERKKIKKNQEILIL